jgi:hypothetical protein
MVLKRFYPGLGLASGVCFLLFAVGVGLLLFADLHSWPLQALVALGALSAALAAVGAALWLGKLVLELGFHLRESGQEAKKRGWPAGSE